MYKEIEELEQRLGRSPASSVEKIDESKRPINVDVGLDPSSRQLIDYGPEKRRSSEGLSRYSPNSPTQTGEIAPDYSGYDDLLKRLEGMKPKDTSTQDLINMGISTGVGLLFGRPAVGAKIAGEYGLDRYNKAEGKTDQLEQMILQLQADRAAKMATGRKGTSNPSGKLHWKEKTYLNERDGKTYRMDFVDENGNLVPTTDDLPIQAPAAKLASIPNPDGTVEVVGVQGNLRSNNLQGIKPEGKQVVANAEGEKFLVGEHSGNLSTIGGNSFNKTSRGLTDRDDKYYESIDKEYTKESLPIRNSHADATSALDALGGGDESGALISLKFSIRSLEGSGKMSDQDYAIVKNNLSPAWSDRIDTWIKKTQNGQNLGVGERKAVRDLSLYLLRSAEKKSEDSMRVYNDKLSKNLRGEDFDRLKFRSQLRPYGPQTQQRNILEAAQDKPKYSAGVPKKIRVNGVIMYGVQLPDGNWMEIGERK